MSFSVPFPPVPNCSFLFPFRLPGSARFYSQSNLLFPFTPAASPLSSQLLLFFMDIMKQIITKLTTNGILLVSETIENQIKIQNCLKLGHFSVTGISSDRKCRLISLLWMVKRKMWCFHFLPFPQSHSRALSHSRGTTVVFPFPTGFPWDPRDPREFPM